MDGHLKGGYLPQQLGLLSLPHTIFTMSTTYYYYTLTSATCQSWLPSRNSNPDEQFWRLSCCHYIRDTLLLAETVRFELTVPYDTTVFKTVAINRTLPHFLYLVPQRRLELLKFGF